MTTLARLAERLPEFEPYRPSATLAEFQRTLLRELDFGREERNLQQFVARFADDRTVKIPSPHSELCTPRVLTMEFLDGVKLSEIGTADGALGVGKNQPRNSFDSEELAWNGANMYLQMIFADGCYHADPHPGNILLLDGNVIGLLDFGMVGRIDERLREEIEEMMLALVNQDAVHLTTVLTRMGKVPHDVDHASLRSDVADFVAHFGAQTLAGFPLGPALTEMMEMLYRYHILLPPQVGLLIKTLVSLEGTAKLLNPRFSIIEVMKPFQKKAILDRLSPARRIRKLRRTYMELEHLADVLPKRVLDITEQIQTGRFDVHLDHRGLGPSINRLVLGMLASALFLGASLMLSQRVPPLLFSEAPFLGMHEISVLGISGCVVSVLVSLRLLRAIGKSGHLDRSD